MIDSFLESYIETALWSSNDGEDYLDNGRHELAEETLTKMRADCAEFIKRTSNLIAPSPQVAHDFWLTRNRHGAGFWDGDYEETLGQTLTDISHEFGEVDLYVGDDGRIYQ